MSSIAALKSHFCDSAFTSLKRYVNHQSLHKNEANGLYPCCRVGCKYKFTRYNAFKAHVYRHHDKSCDLQFDTVQGSFCCQIAQCHSQCVDVKELLAHLRLHLSKKEKVCCPFKACGKTFSLRSSFTAQVSRKHKIVSAALYCATSVPSHSSDVVER